MSIKVSLPKSVQFLRRGDVIVAINPEIPAWVVTDCLGELILSLFNDERTIDEIVDVAVEGLGESFRHQVEEFCKLSLKSGIFEEKKYQERHRNNLHMVHLSLSDKCNLDCVYCYAARRKESIYPKLTLNEYHTLIDDILTINPECGFTITGGEPLLNPLWKDIAQYIKSKGSYSLLLTNGILITDKNIEQIKELFKLVTLSIDGSNAETHAKSRGNNFDKIIATTELLERYEVDYTLSMTVNRLNMHDVEAAAKRFGSRLNFAPLFPVSDITKNKLAISGKEYFTVLRQANGVNPLSYCESSLESAKQYQNHKCAIGDGEISISPTGDVYPCQLLHVNNFLGGNVHETNISEIYRSKPLDTCAKLDVDDIEGCSTCAFKYICGGACRARAYYESGELTVSGQFCEYEKAAFLDGIIGLYSHNAID